MVRLLVFLFICFSSLNCMRNSMVCYASSFDFDNEDAYLPVGTVTITEGKVFVKEDDPEVYELIGNSQLSYFVSTKLINTNPIINQPFKKVVASTLPVNTDTMSNLPVKVISSRQIIKDPDGHFRQYKIEGKENPNCTHPNCKHNPDSIPNYKYGTRKRVYVTHDFKDKNTCSNLTSMPFYPEYYILNKFHAASYTLMEGLFKIINVDDPERLLRLLNTNPLKIFPYMDAELLKAFDILYPNVQHREIFYYDMKSNRLFVFDFEQHIDEIYEFIKIIFQKNLLNCLQPHLFSTNYALNSYHFLEDYLACMIRFYEYEAYELPSEIDQTECKIKQALDNVMLNLPVNFDCDRCSSYRDVYRGTFFILFFKAIIQASEEDFKSPYQFLALMQKISFSIKDNDLNLNSFCFFTNNCRPHNITPYLRSLGGLMNDFISTPDNLQD